MSRDHLREVTLGLRQDGDFSKRWFSCQSADLFVWHDASELVSFEFCYNKHRNEHALSWHQETGFSHSRVDDGEGSHLCAHKGSPIMVAERNIDSDYIYEQFKSLSDKVNIEIRLFIMRKLLGIVVEY